VEVSWRLEKIHALCPYNGAFYFNKIIVCSLPQGLPLLKHQKKQKCFQQRGFFAARAFVLQISQNHGLGKFAPCFAAPTHASAKTPYTPPAHSPPRSARFHPKLPC
jgi:hypothetical protein